MQSENQKYRIRVTRSTLKLKKLVEEHNKELQELENILKRRARLKLLVFDIETELMQTTQEVKKLSPDLELAMAWATQTAEVMNASMNDFIESRMDKPDELLVKQEIFESNADYYKDTLIDVAKLQQKYNEMQDNIKQYEVARVANLKRIDELESEATIKFNGLERTTKLLERVLGYSIGSHTFDWYRDENGKCTKMPQLRALEVEEMYPDAVENKEETLVEVESD